MTGALVRIGFEVMDANLHPGEAVRIAPRCWRRKLRRVSSKGQKATVVRWVPGLE
jgi:hypothetical protein